jgi:hypothetical protein
MSCKNYRPPNKQFEDRRDGIIRRQYGITLDEYNEMLENQDYKCAICGNEDEVEGRRLAIDHCHTSGTTGGSSGTTGTRVCRRYQGPEV